MLNTMTCCTVSRQVSIRLRDFLYFPQAIGRNRYCSFTLAADEINAGPNQSRPKVAAIVTEFTYRSHAHVILENFLEPYLLPTGELHTSPAELTSFRCGVLICRPATDWRHRPQAVP